MTQASALASSFLRRSRRGPERCDLPHLRMLCERHQQISNPTLANFGGDWSSQFTGVPVYSNAQASGASYGLDNCGTTSYVDIGGTEEANGAGSESYVDVGGTDEDAGGEWQCVELVNRLYLTKGWITSHWHGNGNELSDPGNLPPGLTAQAEGHITSIVPGDVVTYVEEHAVGNRRRPHGGRADERSLDPPLAGNQHAGQR